MSVYPELDVKRMLRPILRNYNRHVLRFVSILEKLSCELFYDGPLDFHDHVRDKTVYACSLRIRPLAAAPENRDGGDLLPPAKRKCKVLKCVFPVMLGSDLDHCIRKRGLTFFSREDLTAFDFLNDSDAAFAPADVAASFFLINGCVRHLPYFFTNDPTNTHVVRGQSLVRCYTYDGDDRGKEMSFFAERDERGEYERGDIRVVLNDGTVLRNGERNFFDDCPYETEQVAHMDKVYRDGRFDIDHLGNKVVVSPGHLFVRLFVKYLYRSLKARDLSAVKAKHAIVVRSIETGVLLHVLSKKTVYFRDPPSTMTVVNPVDRGNGGRRPDAGGGRAGNRQRRSVPFSNCGGKGRGGGGGGGVGSGNDLYVEKKTGCYREVSMQTFPLNPYLSYWITRQVSSKVNHANIAAYHPSYVGFLCLVGTFETKNIGRTGMMVRNTTVSVRDDAGEVYDFLRLVPAAATAATTTGESAPNVVASSENYYVVVNEACVRVAESCFRRTCENLENLKKKFKTVECYRDDRFVFVRYKIGLFFKKIYHFSKADHDGTLWVTSRDEAFWKRHYEGRLRPVSFAQLTTYIADLNPFFNHNVFTKNILAFNTLKSAVLSTDPRYSEYFMETLSAYAPVSPQHKTVCRPVDRFSARFALRIPLLTVAYASHKGLNQEDCIVMHRDVRAFDCYRFHTVRFKFETPSRLVSFHPTRGDPDPEGYLLGHLACHDPDLLEFKVCPQTMHTRLEKIQSGGNNDNGSSVASGSNGIVDDDNNNNNNNGERNGVVYKLYFHKSDFRIRSYTLTESRLVVCIERYHKCETGDKLSSFHGQKGVVRTVDSLPVFGYVRDAFGNVEAAPVVLLVNPYCLSRMTPGQILEARFRGGRDHDVLWNSDGERSTTRSPYGIFAGETFYFSVSYFSVEHIHTPPFCTTDAILQQPLRGRSQNGGMRMGNMEILNGMRGNGLAGCYEEKAIEHSDRIFHPLREPAKKRKTRRGENNDDDDDDDDEDDIPLRKRSRTETVKHERNVNVSTPTTKAAHLIKEDLKCFKITMNFRTSPYFVEERGRGNFVDFFKPE